MASRVIGTVFVYLSADDDTVNHKSLLNQIFKITDDVKFTNLIGNMLSNRRFFVELTGQRSKGKTHMIDIPSVMSSVLFTTYIYIYNTDVRAFKKMKSNLTFAMGNIGAYYNRNKYLLIEALT